MRRRLPLRLALVAGAALWLACTAAAGAAEKKKGGGESFTPFPTLTATIIRPSGARGILTVEAGVDAPDEQVRTRANQSLPRLRDAYASALRRYGAGLPPGAPPDADMIGTLLQRETDRIVGRPGARILLGGVLVN